MSTAPSARARANAGSRLCLPIGIAVDDLDVLALSVARHAEPAQKRLKVGMRRSRQPADALEGAFLGEASEEARHRAEASGQQNEVAPAHSILSTPLGLLGAEHHHYAITPADTGVRNLTATVEGTASQSASESGMADAQSAAKRPRQLHRCGTNPNVGSVHSRRLLDVRTATALPLPTAVILKCRERRDVP
jgi:hypothetical protein